MKIDAVSFALGVAFDCLFDIALIIIGKHFLKKRTGGSLRKLYEDNKPNGDDNNV